MPTTPIPRNESRDSQHAGVAEFVKICNEISPQLRCVAEFTELAAAAATPTSYFATNTSNPVAFK